METLGNFKKDQGKEGIMYADKKDSSTSNNPAINTIKELCLQGSL